MDRPVRPAEPLRLGTLASDLRGGPAGTLDFSGRAVAVEASGRPGVLTKGEGVVMKAYVGDRLVPDGDGRRVGVIIGLRNADGTPPYVVKWLSSGHIALVFPGPYTKIVHEDAASADTASPDAES